MLFFWGDLEASPKRTANTASIAGFMSERCPLGSIPEAGLAFLPPPEEKSAKSGQVEPNSSN